MTPGHEVVGEVVAARSDGFAVGDRVGIARLRGTCGTCRYCLRGAENLCPRSRYTGWDEHGVYGFGGSAHLAAQVALARGAVVHVMTRSARARELALELGAASAGGAADPPPEPLDAAILFAPVGDLVLPALAALDRGGTLAIAGIHLSDIPVLDYQRHLFQERQVRSVTANTREDAREFLAFAGTHRLRVSTQPYPLDQADAALADLAGDRVDGAAVLVT